ncbi:YoaK family protein [uncultured Sphingomonas sp.]|uniref:YoaK family protein n=1 Tax=uncultured Sphingomonas sp. TaxID=158754 RepID=UPI0025D87867|nr:YoaK family protein [uncultured Sphingomonas sp.]
MPDAKTAASPLPPLLLLLSVTTGLVDAVSVLGLGKVFTANMTGNIVFLGFAAAGTPGFTIAPYIVALASFLVGALVAGKVGTHLAGQPLRRWLVLAAVVEAVLFGVAAGVAAWAGAMGILPETCVFAIIALTAIAMGFRNATIRQLKVPDLTTTVLTLTLTGIAADSHFAGGRNPNIGRRIAAVVAILLGAFLGAVLVNRYGLAIPLLVAGLTVLVGTLACVRHPIAAEPLRA